MQSPGLRLLGKLLAWWRHTPLTSLRLSRHNMEASEMIPTQGGREGFEKSGPVASSSTLASQLPVYV